MTNNQEDSLSLEKNEKDKAKKVFLTKDGKPKPTVDQQEHAQAGNPLVAIRLPWTNALSGFCHRITYRCAERLGTETALGVNFTKLALVLPESIWQCFQSLVSLGVSDYESATDIFQELFLETVFEALKKWLYEFSMQPQLQERLLLEAQEQIQALRNHYVPRYNRSEEDDRVVAVDKNTGKQWTVQELIQQARTDWEAELEVQL